MSDHLDQLPAALVEYLLVSDQATTAPIVQSPASAHTPSAVQPQQTQQTRRRLQSNEARELDRGQSPKVARSSTTRPPQPMLAVRDALSTSSSSAATATSSTTITPISIILPKPNGAAIAGICVGGSMILFAILYSIFRSHRARTLAQMEASSDCDVEAGKRKKLKEGEKGVRFNVPSAAARKANRTSDSVKAIRGKGWKAMIDDEKTWRREIRKELERETAKVKRDMDRDFPDMVPV